MEKTVITFCNRIKYCSTLFRAKEKDLAWVSIDKSNRATYGIILGQKNAAYDYNFKIFGVNKINHTIIRNASTSELQNCFEREAGVLALKTSIDHPSLSNSLFYFPRVVKGIHGALFIIERKSRFVQISIDNIPAILISVRIKIKDRFHSGLLYPISGKFKSHNAFISEQESNNVNRDAFNNTLLKCFNSSEYNIIKNLALGYKKNEIIEKEFKNSIQSSTYDSYTRDIREKLRLYNGSVPVHMDYFINFCQFYNKY